MSRGEMSSFPCSCDSVRPHPQLCDTDLPARVYYLSVFRHADGAGSCQCAIVCFLQNHLDQSIHPSAWCCLNSGLLMGCFTGRMAGAVTSGKVDDYDLLGTATSSTSTAGYLHSCVNFD